MTMRQRLTRWARFLASPRLFAGIVVWLMIVLVMGTVAQKTMGLYAAQQRYFSAVVIWLFDSVPVPGLVPVAAVVFAGLVARLALGQWYWRNAGTIVIHVGAAMLLLGGFITWLVSVEGVMVIPQNETRDYMEDLRHVEVAITPLSDTGDHDRTQPERVISEDTLRAGHVLTPDGVPFTLEPVLWCRNCALVRLPQTVTAGDPHGVALNFRLQAVPTAPDAENNRAGLTFRLHGTAARDGMYIVFQDMPIPQDITANGRTYRIAVRPVRHALPFALGLQRFEEDLYPGTNTPRAYRSDVVVRDHTIAWPSRIEMNAPLRYKGYTFYQSSFMEGQGDTTTTVLAVVKNAGRLFPYVSSAILALGFVIHLIQRLGYRARRTVADQP